MSAIQIIALVIAVAVAYLTAASRFVGTESVPDGGNGSF